MWWMRWTLWEPEESKMLAIVVLKQTFIINWVVSSQQMETDTLKTFSGSWFNRILQSADLLFFNTCYLNDDVERRLLNQTAFSGTETVSSEGFFLKAQYTCNSVYWNPCVLVTWTHVKIGNSFCEISTLQQCVFTSYILHITAALLVTNFSFSFSPCVLGLSVLLNFVLVNVFLQKELS